MAPGIVGHDMVERERDRVVMSKTILGVARMASIRGCQRELSLRHLTIADTTLNSGMGLPMVLSLE